MRVHVSLRRPQLPLVGRPFLSPAASFVRNAGSGLRTCSIRSNGVFGPREPHFIQRVASQAQVCVCGGILTTCFDLHVTQHVAWLQSKQPFTVLGSGRFALAAARVYAC